MKKSFNKELDVSVVIPLFNEEENVELLHSALDDVFEKLSYNCEIIFVDDGSKDSTFSKMTFMQDSSTKQ